MRTEQEIRSRIENNKIKLKSDRISQYMYSRLSIENSLLEWVLGAK
jgi:hypothetical protein